MSFRDDVPLPRPNPLRQPALVRSPDAPPLPPDGFELVAEDEPGTPLVSAPSSVPSPPDGFEMVAEEPASTLPPGVRSFGPSGPLIAPPERDATFMESVGRGVDTAQQMGYAGIEALGEVTGLETLTSFGAEGRIANQKEIEAGAPRSRVADVRGVGDLTQWGKETIGEQIPIMAPGLAGAAAGGIGGFAVGGPVGASVGALLGAFVPSLIMGTGEVQTAIKEKDPDAVAPGYAFAGGSAIAALDTVLPGKVGSKLLKTFGGELAEEVASRALTREINEGFITRTAKGAAEGMATEGVTEALQEAIGEVAATQATGTDIDPGALAEQMAEAFIGGAFLGFGIGGVTSMPEPRGAGTATDSAVPPPPEGFENVPEGAAPADTLYPGPEAAPPAAAPVATAETAEVPIPRPNPTPAPAAAPVVAATPAQAEAQKAFDILAPDPVQAPTSPADAPSIQPEVPTKSADAPSEAAEAPTNAPVVIPPPDGFVREGTRKAPAVVETAADMEAAAATAAAEPSDAQKQAGNYAKAHVKLQGLDISIENPKGSMRRGTAADGTAWEVKMPAAYGYVKRTEGADGDQVDVYVGDHPQVARVFIVDQVNPETGAFDEHKAFLGVPSEQAARSLYDRGFSDGKGKARMGGVTTMSIDEFKGWLKSGDTTKPLSSPKAAQNIPENITDEPVAPSIDEEGRPNPAASVDKPAEKSAPVAEEVDTPAASEAPAVGRVLLDKLLDKDMDTYERRHLAGGDLKIGAGILAAYADQETDYDRLSRLAQTVTQTADQDRRPHRSTTKAKAKRAEEDAADTAWASRDKARSAVRATIDKKRAELVAGALKDAGLKSGDRVRYTEGLTDGRTGEASQETSEGILNHSDGSGSADIRIGGGILFLTPDDIKNRVEKVDPAAGKPADAAPPDETVGESWPHQTMPAAKVFPAPKKTLRMADSAGEEMTPTAAKAIVDEWKAIAKKIGEMFDNSDKAIISLFDYSGNWSQPYRDAGFEVVQYDVEFAKDADDYVPGDEKYFDILQSFPGADISEMKTGGMDIYGVLAATPCTTFANSGTRWRESLHDKKDRAAIEKVWGEWVPEGFESPLEVNQMLVAATQAVIELANPSGFHVMENPIGRIAEMNELPDPLLRFDPNLFGDDYTKKTQLWGDFDPALPTAHVHPGEGSKISTKLRGDDPKQKRARSLTPTGFAYAFFIANAPKDQVAAARKALADEAKPEHPGLVIKSLETGKETTIQPAGTKEPKAKPAKAAKAPPKRAEKSTWSEIGKNAKGQTLYQDENGVRSRLESGVRISETVGFIPGGGIEIKPREGTEWDIDVAKTAPVAPPTEEAPEPAAAPEWWTDLTEAGRAPLIAKASSTLSPRTTWQNLSAENRRKVEAAYEAQRKAERDAPTWAEVLHAAPLDAKGRPDTDMIFSTMEAITGGERTYAKLTPEQKGELLAAMTAAKAELAVPDRPQGYGAGNKLVTADRAEVLRTRLKAKLRNQVNAGIDPEILAIGAELAAFHIEAGARKFADFSRAIAKDLGVSLNEIRPYLRSWYNGARDMMEDGGFDVAGMDSPDDVREALKGLSEATTDESGNLEDAGAPVLAGEPAEEVQGTQRRGAAGSGSRLRSPADAPGDVEPRGERADPRRGVGADEERVFVPAAEPVESAATPARDRSRSYVLTDADGIGDGGAKTKFNQNIAAIKTLKRAVIDEGRRKRLTPDEQKILAKYVGWGGLKQAFPREDGTFVKGWEDAGKELRAVLDDAEYKAARASTQNAHYTSPTVVRAMWKAVERLGFRGGRMLEPSVGTGNFIGFMPATVRDAVQVNAVELDRITGAIAMNLYPDDNVQAPIGFQDFTAPDGWFDLAIGNPPFGAVRLYDPRRKKLSRFSIHNFFFAKSVDMLREDGVLAMVVTNFMMDASRDGAREYIASKTELLGAIRLPNDAFAKNAGTEVTTDIVFLRKLKAGEKAKGESWLEAKVFKDKEGREVLLNEYFVRHPEQMLGEFGAYGEMYAEASAALIARPGQDTAALLDAAIARLPQGIMPAPGALIEPGKLEVPEEASQAAIGSMFLTKGGEVWIRQDTIAGEAKAEPVDFESDRGRDRVAGMVQIRDAFTNLRRAQLDEAVADDEIAALRQALNTVYDAFVAKQGPINADANKRLFRDDPTWPQISALEDGFDKGLSPAVAKKTGEKPREPSAKKAPVFTKRTQSPYRAPTSASSAKDALAAALVETGRADMGVMSRLYGRSEEEIATELGGLLFKNPVGGYETRDHYLSGNVKQKLAIAERAAQSDPKYSRNIEALKEAIPADIDAVDINVKPGSHWIPPKHIAAFANHINETGNARATYVSATASWLIESARETASAATRWGTDRASPREVLLAAVNGRSITIRDKHSDGSTPINQAATDAANAKVELVKAEWKRWIWSDDARRTELHRIYNDSFNTDRRREYDGSHLTFPGKVGDDIIRLRPHQSNMIWRAVQSGTALLDHVVGAGKTFTMIGSAMEMRRMGLAKKPMFVVPNHLVGQWAADFIRLYPGAKILAATKADFEAENRKRLFARVATGDYDAVIVAHSSFGKIAVDPQFEKAFIEEQLEDLEASIEAVKIATGEKKSRTVAQIEKQRDNLRAKLQRLLDAGGKDDSLTFEELGIDALFVDEGHEFKNLGFSTSMQRVAGLGNQTGSQKAADLYVKVQSVLARTGGRNVVFATGTPISNTMAEMYTMQRYLDGRVLKDQGLSHFDAWARMFGEVVHDWELSPAGKYKLNSRFSKFVNMPELMQRYLSFADVITNDDIKRQLASQGRTLPLPKVKGGKPQNMVVERSKAQAAYIGEAVVDENGNESYKKGTLIWRSENLPKGPPQKGDDNMLKIMSDARKAALDMRLINPGAADAPGSKVHVAADNILKIYKQWTPQRGTQLVFIDLSTPRNARAKEAAAIRELVKKAEEGDEAASEKLDAMSPDEFDALTADFSVYDDLKQKLIQRGIPANEIAFIHDAGTELQKEELFGKVRSGRVRVMFGSTAKMGAGMNVQNRLVALHHLDAPWRPSDLEQREGRIIRQGNELYLADPEGFEVEVLRYATKNTLDARMWQTIEGKARFIEQVRKGDAQGREIEDVAGEAANAAEMKAAASGNPLILEEMDLRQQLRRLDTAQYNHNREQYRIRDAIKQKRSTIEDATKALPNATADSEVAKAIPKEFSMTIAGEVFEKPSLAGAAILVEYGKMVDGDASSAVLGSYGGFKLRIEASQRQGEHYISLVGTNRHFAAPIGPESDALGTAMRVKNTVVDIADEPIRLQGSIDRAQKELPNLEAQLVAWPEEGKFTEVKARHEAVLSELRPKPKPPAAPNANPEGPPLSGPSDSQVRGSVATEPFTVTRDQVVEASARVQELAGRILGHRIRATVAKELPAYMAADYIAAWDPVDRAIWLSMRAARDIGTLANNVGHESLHALRYAGVITDTEWRLLVNMANRNGFASSEQSRKTYERQYVDIGGATPAQFRDMMDEEAVARMFGAYVQGRETGTGADVLMARVREFLEALMNLMRGTGFQSATGTMREAYEGRLARRDGGGRLAGGSARGVAETFDPENPTLLGSAVDPTDLGAFAAGGAEARQVAVNRGLNFQPVDRMLRLPFDIFGGTNEKGEWKPGLYLSQQASRIIGTARFTEESRFRFMNPILHRARAGLVDRYGLDDTYVARERQRALEERGMLAEVPDIMKALQANGIGGRESRVLHDILTGQATPIAEWNHLSEPIRNAIDQFGAEAVELGLISAESFERNRGTYLHRVYLKHENDQGGLARWATQLMSTRRKKIIGNEVKGRGIFKEVDPQDIPTEAGEAIVDGARYVMFDKMSADGTKVVKREWRKFGQHAPIGPGWVSRGAFEVRSRKNGYIILWRDYTREERQRMGEIVDARYTIAKTYMTMAHDLSVGRFYRDIARNADWSTGTEPSENWKEAGDYKRWWADPSVEWVRVPDTIIPKSNTKRYGAIAGRWVRAEIWRDINELEHLNHSNLWQGLLTQWKLNKTARSPVVHMNNIISNLVLMDMSGVGVSDLVAGIRALVSGDELYREAEHHGAFGADMATQEIRRNILQPILKEVEQGIQGGGTLESQFGIIGAIADGIWGAAKFADRKMLELYQLEDEVFRMALYARRRTQGVSPQEAADETRQQFIDYDIRAPWINAARRTVLPFLSYAYRAIPLLAKTVMTRPWKIAKYMAIMYAAEAISYALLPGDEDEERRSMREEEQGWTWLGAPRMLRLPFADDHGNPHFLDIRRWIPAGDVFDTAQGSAAIGIPSWLSFSGPIMMAAELVLNKQGFTGKPITNDLTDDWWDKTSKIGDWAWKSWMPSAAWIPGSWYWEKIGNAISGARDWQGNPYDTPAALLSSIGIKVRPQDVQEGFRIWGLEFDRVERELKSERKRLSRDFSRGLLSRDEYEGQFAKVMDKLRALSMKRQRTLYGE